MKSSAKKEQSAPTSSASVVDGKLILSLPDAATPVVWQMDLEQARSSALEVREDAASGRFVLALKTQKGENVDIASYEEKAAAVKALMTTSKALENAHGKIRPVSAVSGGNDGANAQQYAAPVNHRAPAQQNSSVASAILAVLLIVILISAWAFSIPKASDTIARARSTNTGASAGPTDTGVPVSADDFFNKRQ